MDSLEHMKKEFTFIADVRGVGLMIGVEIVKENNEPDVELTNYIAKRAMDYGLILRTSVTDSEMYLKSVRLSRLRLVRLRCFVSNFVSYWRISSERIYYRAWKICL